MVQSLKERSEQSMDNQYRNKRKQELMQSYREAAQKNFKVEKEDFNNDLIMTKLKKYMYK
ncbi:hypothetical protein [Gracilibacillus phocaeensis]|uniref:hypothetical protein n=1 Tax=Gracilibacillus phocaeensis TaxID=2042304 RepID=UPI00102F3577|nr:hypothetical protein [Gracilibacillus phocaeensis]